MELTNNFFSMNNTGPDVDFVQLIDSNTFEIYNFKKLGGINHSANNATIFYWPYRGSYYKRIFEGAINVKWFGAKGDGITDDTTAIQEAFNFMFESRNHNINKIIFPNGEYLVTNILRFPSKCELTGVDKLSSKIITDMNNKDLIFIAENIDYINNGVENETWTSIKNITLGGKHRNSHPVNDPIITTYPENQFNNGIVIHNLFRTHIENVIIEGFETSGILYSNTYYHRFNNILLRKNKIGMLITDKCTSIYGINSEFRWNSIGQAIFNSYSLSFVNCLIEANTTKYTSTPTDFNNSPTTSYGTGVLLVNSKNNTYTNCYFEFHICTFHFINSHENVVNHSFITSGINPVLLDSMNNLNGYCGYLNNSTYNIFEKNYHKESFFSNISKFFFTPDSTNNFFEFTDRESFNKFIQDSNIPAAFTNLSDDTPSAVCPGINKTYFRGKVTELFSLGSFYGSSGSRPPLNTVNIGFQYFDTTLNKPVWSDGSNWRDSDGIIV